MKTMKMAYARDYIKASGRQNPSRWIKTEHGKEMMSQGEVFRDGLTLVGTVTGVKEYIKWAQTQAPVSEKNYVYVIGYDLERIDNNIQSVMKDYVKIGCSDNVTDRIKQIQMVSPLPLKLLHSVKHPQGRSYERGLHLTLLGIRAPAKNEWFNLSGVTSREELFAAMDSHSLDLVAKCVEH